MSDSWMATRNTCNSRQVNSAVEDMNESMNMHSIHEYLGRIRVKYKGQGSFFNQGNQWRSINSYSNDAN